MGDDNGDEPPENQARIYMRVSSADGFEGGEVEVTVEGGDGETVDDIAAEARERFEQAAGEASTDGDGRRELQ